MNRKSTELSQALRRLPGVEAEYQEAVRQQEIGARLRAWREHRGLTQLDVAGQAGLNQGDISRLETGKWGKRGLSFDLLGRVLPVLGLKVQHSVAPLGAAPRSPAERQHLRVLNELL